MSRWASYVDVAPAIPLPKSGQSVFTYQLPEKLASSYAPADLIGRPVIVPWRSRKVRGVITNIRKTPVPFPTRPLEKISSLRLTSEQIEFARWISHTMQGGLGYTLRLFLPPTL